MSKTPTWDMDCGHFDAYGDPSHDCSTWDDDADEVIPTPTTETRESAGESES